MDINFGSLGRPTRGGRGGRGGRGRGAPAAQRSPQKDGEVVSVHEKSFNFAQVFELHLYTLLASQHVKGRDVSVFIDLRSL